MVDQDIDSFVDAFEQACACDGGADLTDYLPAANHPKYGEIIVEIARVDLELAWGRTAKGRYVERYQSMFPDVLRHADALERVAFEEYRSRPQAGHSVTPADYQTRLSINTQDWPLLQTSPSTSSTTRGDRTLTASDDLLRESSSDGRCFPGILGTRSPWRAGGHVCTTYIVATLAVRESRVHDHTGLFRGIGKIQPNRQGRTFLGQPVTDCADLWFSGGVHCFNDRALVAIESEAVAGFVVLKSCYSA